MNQSALGDRLDVHLDRELDELARIADGADFAEGIDAFFGKRPPRFQGK
jgi:enoyl-CoA hydratase/carnithine racemase